MEQETLYTAAKWDILKSLSKGKKSPIELAEEARTSISNISQSLRFLELAGIVKSERISNRDKGLPRVVYTLSSDKAYLIVTAGGFVEKKHISLDATKRAFLRIWLYDEVSLQPYIERAYIGLLDDIDSIKSVYLDKTVLSEIRLAVVLKEKAKLQLQEKQIKIAGATRKVKFSITDESAIRKDSDSYYPIHAHQSVEEMRKA